MSASGNDREARTDGGEVAVGDEDVEVVKTYDEERFPVPAIAFSIRSERDESVVVRLIDRVPEGVSMDDIGFHPEYGSEFWSVEGRTLVYERELAADEDTETVYGIRGPDAEDPERFLETPTVEVWTGSGNVGSLLDDVNEPLLRGATLGTENGDDGASAESETGDALHAETEPAEGPAANDATGATGGIDRIDNSDDDDDGEVSEDSEDSEDGTDGEGERGTDGTENSEANDVTVVGGGNGAEANGDDVPTTDEDEVMDENAATDTQENGADESTDVASTTDAGVESDGSDADGTTSDGADDGSPRVAEGTLAATLVRELRDGRIDADDREALRDALGARDSVTARIDHLRSSVDDLAAYTDALESFVDENGSARQLVRRQTERADALREDVESVTERAATNNTAVESIGEDVERIDRDVAAFQNAISDLDGEVERIDERFETIETEIGSVDDRVTEVDERIDAIDDRLDTIERDRESELEDLRADVQADIDERAGETDVERLAEEVEALQAWRSQLSAVLGGTAGEAGTTATETENGSQND